MIATTTQQVCILDANLLLTYTIYRGLRLFVVLTLTACLFFGWFVFGTTGERLLQRQEQP